MSLPAQERVLPCSRCGGNGVRYDEHVEAGRHGTLRICACIEEKCRCGDQQPYQYWDEESKRQWCDCAPSRRRLADISRMMKEADIPSRFRWKFRREFRSTAPGGGTPLTVAKRAMPVVDYLAALIDDDREPPRGYFFFGTPGSGKTLLSCIILNELILHRVRRGRFLNLSRKYFQQLRDTYSERSEHYGQTWRIMDELCRMPYLVLDDLGVQRGTEWEMEMLYDLIDARYGEELFTVVTTNQPMDDLRQLADGRIYSRLVEMCYMVDMTGEDFRLHSRLD